jgi:hypothetical protein
MKSLLFFLFGLTAVAVTAQEILVPLSFNADQAEAVLHSANQRSRSAFYDTIALYPQGIRDNFAYDSHTANDTIWDMTVSAQGTYVNRTWAIAPLNLGVCTFDGLDYAGRPYDSLASVNSTGLCDYLTSLPIDLSTKTVADSVYLSFWYQAEGRGYYPNTQDSLLLDFNIPSWNPDSATTIWKTIWYTEGFNPSSADSSFRIALIKLDSASYFVKGFKFRFRNYAARCGSNDHWHLDEVYLNAQRTMNDTVSKHVDFVYQATSALANYWSVPNTHYKPNLMATGLGVTIRNNDTTSLGRSTTYSYFIYDETGAQVSSGMYNAGTGTSFFYGTNGYMNTPGFATPPVVFSYPQLPVNSDTTTFVQKHILSAGLQDIDTMVQIQRFYNYYAYDDGSAEAGYGLYGTYAQLAYKFKMEGAVADTLTAVQMYFLPVQDIDNLGLREWSLRVWAADGPAGEPGTLIYEQQDYHIQYVYQSVNRFATYELDSGTVVLSPGQEYYIGWYQEAIDRMYIGFDFNTDKHTKIYQNTNGTWQQSVFNGALMMRPVFDTPYNASGITEPVANTPVELYPNPANDVITIKGVGSLSVTVDIIDISGRIVLQKAKLNADGTLDISVLAPGVYYVREIDAEGELVAVQKLIVTR